MSSPEPPAAGKPAATPLDDKDEALLARFLAAGAQYLFEYPSKEEVTGKKGKKDQARRRANRDARNLSALQTLEAPAANYQPEEPDEESVAMQATLTRLDERGVPWRLEFIRLMAYAAEFGAAATEEVMQRRRAATAEQEDEQRAETAEEEDEDDDAADTAAYDAAMAMAQQRAAQRLEQQQQLDAERRRKLLDRAQPMTAAEAKAAAAAEGLQLEASDNATGFAGVRYGPATAIRRPFQAVHGDESLGYFETAEEAALVYARRAAPGKAAKVAREIEKEREAREAAARAEARAEVRAQRQAAAKAKADAAAALRTQPPNKVGLQISIARYAAFAHEFNVPGAAPHESYCVAFNVASGGCSRQHLCPFKHEMPPSFDPERWRAAFNETYRTLPPYPYPYGPGICFKRIRDSFWRDIRYKIKCVRNQWPDNGPKGFIECTFKGCVFYWSRGELWDGKPHVYTT